MCRLASGPKRVPNLLGALLSRYAHPYRYRYMGYRYAHPYRYRYMGYRYAHPYRYQYAGLYNYRSFGLQRRGKAMKKFHPALVALTIIGSIVIATATRAETQDTGYQGNAQYARPYHSQYAHPYHSQYAHRRTLWP